MNILARNKVVKNAAWIIGVKVVQAVVNMLIAMLTARYLGPSNYGQINYAASLVAFFTPIMQLGLNGTLVQELVNHPECEGETMGTAVLMNIASGLLCVVGLIAFASLSAVGDTETTVVCALYSISMLMEAVHILQYWFQARLLSKYTSLAMLAAYVIASIYQVFLLVTGKSIYWFAVSKVLDIAIIDVILIRMYHRCGGKRLVFSWDTGRSLLKKSRFYILANMMVVIFAQTDRIMLKMMIDDAATGYYSAAVACASLTSFVFSAIIQSMHPVILENYKSDRDAFERSLTTLYSIIVYLSVVQCIFIAGLAPFIIRVLYGEAYALAVRPLRCIVWYTTFSYIGSANWVYIQATNNQAVLWKMNVVGAVANVILNYAMIPVWGIEGAAIASLLTQIITNIGSCFIFKTLRPIVGYLKEGLNGKNLIRGIRYLR